jgi:hypothetical protein
MRRTPFRYPVRSAHLSGGSVQTRKAVPRQAYVGHHEHLFRVEHRGRPSCWSPGLWPCLPAFPPRRRPAPGRNIASSISGWGSGGWSIQTAPLSSITPSYSRGECFLHKSYTTPGGYAGESFNIYGSTRGVWHQSWVDSGGLLLQLEGELDDGSMVLEGPGIGRGGVPIINRITWSVVNGDPDHVR